MAPGMRIRRLGTRRTTTKSIYQVANDDVKINTELMYKQLQAAEQSRQSNTPHYFSRVFAVQARSQTKAFNDPSSPSKSQ